MPTSRLNPMPKSKKKQENLKPLNFRDFPADLAWLAKECAARKQMQFKEYVISVLREATARDSK
jgi:hypothetical protein